MLPKSSYLSERTLPSGPLCLWQYFVDIQSNLELNLSIVFLNLQPRSRHRINIFVKGRRIMNKIMKQDENVHLAVQKQKQKYSCMNIYIPIYFGGGGAKSCSTDPRIAHFFFRTPSFWTKDVVKIQAAAGGLGRLQHEMGFFPQKIQQQLLFPNH